MSRLALLLSLLALGLVACDGDDETATAETEVITSDFAQDPPGRGRVAIAGGPEVCGSYRRGTGGLRVEIDVISGVVRCREARRVLESYHRDDSTDTRPWSCEDYGQDLVQCTMPGGTAFRGILACGPPVPGHRPDCPGFPPSAAAPPEGDTLPSPPSTPEQNLIAIKQTANRWTRLFAASDPDGCPLAMTQPACERMACQRVGAIKPIPNCTRPSAEFRKSFRGATVESVVIRGPRAAALFSNGRAIELGRVLSGAWLIAKFGENAGREFGLRE